MTRYHCNPHPSLLPESRTQRHRRLRISTSRRHLKTSAGMRVRACAWKTRGAVVESVFVTYVTRDRDVSKAGRYKHVKPGFDRAKNAMRPKTCTIENTLQEKGLPHLAVLRSRPKRRPLAGLGKLCLFFHTFLSAPSHSLWGTFGNY